MIKKFGYIELEREGSKREAGSVGPSGMEWEVRKDSWSFLCVAFTHRNDC
jgi:hypothetical protein